MNKAELINAAAEKAGLSKKDTETAINAAIEVISDCLAEGDKVQLVGFGAAHSRRWASFSPREPLRWVRAGAPKVGSALRRRGGCPHPPAGR